MLTFDELKAHRDAGVSLLPIGTNKRPLTDLLPMVDGERTWKPFQNSLPFDAELQRWAEHGIQAVAVIGGQVSGNLLILDFDERDFYTNFMLRARGLVRDCPIQKTGGGGYQIFLRCPEPGPNQKLAWSLDGRDKSIAIETRGEGGYALIPPSLHPSGALYQWLRGTTADIPFLEQSVVEDLLYIARDLNQVPPPPPPKSRPSQESIGSGTHIIDAFNQMFTVEQILEEHGYKKRGEKYLAPTSTSKAPGVVILDGRCYSHHSNDPLNDGHTHDAYGVHLLLAHKGDVNAAFKSAAQRCGIKRESPPERAERPLVPLEALFDTYTRVIAEMPATPLLEGLYEALTIAFEDGDRKRMEITFNEIMSREMEYA